MIDLREDGSDVCFDDLETGMTFVATIENEDCIGKIFKSEISITLCHNNKETGWSTTLLGYSKGWGIFFDTNRNIKQRLVDNDVKNMVILDKVKI